jgi:GDP-D-mannose dehydratase
VDEMIDYVVTIIIRLLSFSSKWIEQNVINTVLEFVKSFEHLLMVLTVVAFFLIIIYMTMKQLKKLPKFYVIEIEDIYGNKTAVDGLRTNFTTYTAAKSYAHFYSNLYGEQYKFRIVGRNRILNYPHN